MLNRPLHRSRKSIPKFQVVKINQRTIGPVSLTWVLRICWIRTNWEIQKHSMLYKLPPIQKHQEQIWPCHKTCHGQPRIIIWKKPLAMGIQPLGTSSGSILKLLLFPSFCTSSRKIPFPSLFYMIFCFISYMCIKTQDKKRQPLGTIFDASRKVLSLWSLVTCFKKYLCPLILCTFFMILYMYIAFGQGQITHLAGADKAKILMSTGRPHHYGHLLQV